MNVPSRPWPVISSEILPSTELKTATVNSQADHVDTVGEGEARDLGVELVAGSRASHEVRDVGAEGDAAGVGAVGGEEVEDLRGRGTVPDDGLIEPATDV